jgi:TRAP-type mannitol/chloroaromatic compound transport system substrate-binding protein
MKKLFLILLLVVFAGTLIFSGCAKETGKVYNLRIQSAWPHGDLSYETLHVFAEAASKRSNGRLVISTFAAPDIVGMFEVSEAVKKGTLDMAHGAGNLWSGIIPIGDVEFGLPYGYRVPEEKTFESKADAIRKFYYESGLLDLLREQYATQGVYYLDMHLVGPVPFMVATKPIQTVNDFKGLRIRTDGMWMEWENGCGANGVDISGDEGYMALKLGTVDAGVWDSSCVTGLSWHEVAPYWIHGEENDNVEQHILVNQNVWNSLPDDLKQALRGAAEDYYYACRDAYKKDLDACYDLAKQGKLTEVWMDKDLIALHEQVGYALWDEVAGRDAACAKAVQMIKKWRGIK